MRIGLTAGAVTIHSNADRGVFAAVGDPMNVAARLRDLNREVGSLVLASEDVIKELESKLNLRPIAGSFPLKGITHRPVVFEIVGLATGRDERKADLSYVPR